eukprot:COSAG01_NODE_2541_length_7477_cov_3.164226_6_plen_70_part_00
MCGLDVRSSCWQPAAARLGAARVRVLVGLRYSRTGTRTWLVLGLRYSTGTRIAAQSVGNFVLVLVILRL